jgi:hypothetical protein
MYILPTTNPSNGSYKTTRLAIIDEFTTGYKTGAPSAGLNGSMAGDFYFEIGITADSYARACHGYARLARASLAHCVEVPVLSTDVASALTWLSQFDSLIAAGPSPFTRCNKLDMQMGAY